MENIYPTLSSSSKPVEITQEVGQVLYIPEGWYHASVPLEAATVLSVPIVSPPLSSGPVYTSQRSETPDFYSLLTSCGGCVAAPLHADHVNNTDDDFSFAESTPSSVPHTYALSIQQEASSPEVIHSEFYHIERGKKLMSQAKYENAIDTFLQGVALGQGVDEVDIGSSEPFSVHNDYSLVGWLGTAYAAVGDIVKAEKSLVFAISLNR